MTKLSASIFSRLRAMAGLLLVSATHLQAASTTHVVAKGDTLSGLALKYDCSVQVLKDLNRLNSDVIVLGRTLRLPDAEMEGGAVKFVHRQDRIVVNTRQAPALVNREVLEESNGENTSVVVDVIRQRIYLLVKGRVAIDSPISTGRPGHPTPRGMFVITERVQSGKISNRYGSLMPNWMRLGNTAVGMHTGKLPGKPDSHGCIRLPDMIAPIIFSHTKAGTSVRVLDSWTLPASDVAAR